MQITLIGGLKTGILPHELYMLTQYLLHMEQQHSRTNRGSVQNHFAFYITVNYLLPKSRIAIRQFDDRKTIDGKINRVKGFRIIASQGCLQWAVFAYLLATEIAD